MRFRIKSGQSARRFVFDRTPSPAKPPQPSAPRAAGRGSFVFYFCLFTPV